MREWIEKLESDAKNSKIQCELLTKRAERFQNEINHAIKMGLITTKLGAEKIFIDFFKDVENLGKYEKK